MSGAANVLATECGVEPESCLEYEVSARLRLGLVSSWRFDLRLLCCACIGGDTRSLILKAQAQVWVHLTSENRTGSSLGWESLGSRVPAR